MRATNPARTSAIATPRRGNRSVRGMGEGFATEMSPTRASFLPLLRRDHRFGSVVADRAAAAVRHVDHDVAVGGRAHREPVEADLAGAEEARTREVVRGVAAGVPEPAHRAEHLEVLAPLQR